MTQQTTSGIYAITNVQTLKFYIGSAVNLQKRRCQHFSALNGNRHTNIKLQNSFNKHGQDAFAWEVLEYCNKKKLIEREQCYLDSTQCFKDGIGYNICPSAGSRFGATINDNSRIKVSQAQRKRYESKEERQKTSEANKKRYESEAERQKTSEACKGRVAWNKGLPAWNKGISPSEESKRKMSEAKKGKPPNNKGVPRSEETKRKISEAHKLRHLNKIKEN